MDNPWIEKEIQWRADLAEKIAAQARADADKLAGRFIAIDYLARIRMGPRQVASGSRTSPPWVISTSPALASSRAASRASSIRSRQSSPPTARAASDGQMLLAGPRSWAMSQDRLAQ